ncbi:hypothetical protein CDL15_Pgr010213 [Punica granatum]|uniref:Pentatricopeptide repeat-containing protein At2g22410, mitochondrial-like n=1 Tax=Punica granatum TaxID=22663 RepID=A0A218XRM9_PUNGR|nr:hypothetical protein CDL15_Pgr010213 [Punica granatum]
MSKHHMRPLLQFLHNNRSFSSLAAPAKRNPPWNSPTNVIITHPVLLTLESCSSMPHLKQIHAHMTRTRLIAHTFPASRVLAFSALSDSADMDYARALFSQIEEPNTFMWNTMIRGYCRAGVPSMGMLFYRRMVRECVEMDQRSFVFALKACELLGGVRVGESMHCRIWKLGFDCYVLVRNGLIRFYSKFGSPGLARKVFDESTLSDVVTWTSMIDGYAMNNLPNEALDLFDSMLVGEVEPNEVTMIAVISACSQKGDVSVGRRIHEFITKENLSCRLTLLNSLLDMYIKCGCLSDAREIFETLETRDVFSWTSMVNGYAKFGEFESARKLFDAMPERNVVSWNAMIAGYSQNNQPKEALELFQEMLESGLVPIENTLVCVLSACGQMGCLEMGRIIHDRYIKSNKVRFGVILGNALIDMYAKCGQLDSAAYVFHEMPARDIVTWNSMINGYAVHGRAKEALLLFDQLRRSGLNPDDITLVGILSACSHCGLLNEAREYFGDMEREFGIEPKVEHYACMIDLYGRNGLLEEAHELLMQMPLEPSESTWGALLNASRMHGNIELAKLAAGKLIDLDPKDSGIYVLLANTFAKGKKWSDVRVIRSAMRVKNVRKAPGQSLIEVDGEFHEFVAADEAHPQSEEIYRVLENVTLQCDLGFSFKGFHD